MPSAFPPLTVPANAPVPLPSVALGLTWVPYVVIGIALVVMAVVVDARARARARTHRDIGRAEFVLVRAVALALIGVTVSLLADAAAEGDGLTALDRPGWSWLIEHRTGALTWVAMVVTEVGSTVVMGVLALFAAAWLYFRRKQRADAALIAAVAAGAGLLVMVSKPIVGRVRPPVEFRLVTETNQSFPSGHALASIAVLGVLAAVFVPRWTSPPLRWIGYAGLVVIVLAIGISRLYLGVHWPTDVVGGWLTGAGWLLLCLTVHGWWSRYGVVVRRPLATSVDHRRRLQQSDPRNRST